MDAKAKSKEAVEDLRSDLPRELDSINDSWLQTDNLDQVSMCVYVCVCLCVCVCVCVCVYVCMYVCNYVRELESPNDLWCRLRISTKSVCVCMCVFVCVCVCVCVYLCVYVWLYVFMYTIMSAKSIRQTYSCQTYCYTSTHKSTSMRQTYFCTYTHDILLYMYTEGIRLTNWYGFININLHEFVNVFLYTYT